MKYKKVKETFKDPVCGMEVSRLTALATCEYNGKTYYFCAEICRDKFEKEPDKYISKWLPPEL
jgi:YHS domain-containing protein